MPAACTQWAARRGRSDGPGKGAMQWTGGDGAARAKSSDGAFKMRCGAKASLPKSFAPTTRCSSALPPSIPAVTPAVTPAFVLHVLSFVLPWGCVSQLLAANPPAAAATDTMLEFSCPSSVPSTGPPQSHTAKLPSSPSYVPLSNQRSRRAAATAAPQ